MKHRPEGGRGARSGLAGLDALAARYALSPLQTERLATVAARVIEDPLAPTAVRDPRGVLAEHLADSLVALDLEIVRRASSVADLGAGAGFPGLPLAIALPAAAVALVEANRRKCDFMRALVEACGALNASVVTERAESWTDGLGACDLVTARALAPLVVVAEYAAPLLRIGGALVAWRGRRDPEDEDRAHRAAAELGLTVEPPRRVEPFAGAVHRHLHVLVKTGPTPARFPRRPGIARKRPLG